MLYLNLMTIIYESLNKKNDAEPLDGVFAYILLSIFYYKFLFLLIQQVETNAIRNHPQIVKNRIIVYCPKKMTMNRKIKKHIHHCETNNNLYSFVQNLNLMFITK